MASPGIDYTIRSYFQLIDSGQLDRLSQLVTSGYQLHLAGLPEPLNLERAARLIAGFQATFPDLRHDIEQVDSADGRVRVQIAAAGVLAGDSQATPARGRGAQLATVHTFAFVDGRIAEQWIDLDMTEIVRQVRGDATAASRAVEFGRMGASASAIASRETYHVHH